MNRKILFYLFVIPSLLLIIFIIVIPGIQTIYWSFFEIPFGLSKQYVGFKNFIELFSDSVFRRAIFNTMLFSFITVIGQIGFGLISAILLNTEFTFKKFLVSIIIMPYAVSSVVAIIIWKFMLRSDTGILSYFIKILTPIEVINWTANALHAWIVLILIEIWLRSPFSFLVLYSAIMGIPIKVLEASYIDGASNFQTIRYVILPMIFPALTVVTIFAFIFAFRGFDVVWMLTNGGPLKSTELLSTLLYRQGFIYWESGMAAAIALFMTLGTFVIALYYLRIISKS
jgi:multiple sugar transport system permease protein